jgi:hypothetical protein
MHVMMTMAKLMTMARSQKGDVVALGGGGIGAWEREVASPRGSRVIELGSDKEWMMNCRLRLATQEFKNY